MANTNTGGQYNYTKLLLILGVTAVIVIAFIMAYSLGQSQNNIAMEKQITYESICKEQALKVHFGNFLDNIKSCIDNNGILVPK